MGYICYDVRCPNCAEAFYETTELYDPNKMTTGEMLRFKKKYGPEGYNWSLPFSDHDMSEGIVCVECGGPLAPSGKVKVEPLSFAEGIAQSAEGENPQAEIAGIPVLNATEEEEEQLSILSDHTESSQEEELVEDPMAKYLTQKACPECGRFFGVDEWEVHLASHTPEVRAQILKPIEPAKSMEHSAEGKNRPERGKGKGKKNVREVNEPELFGMACPFCELSFEHNPEFEAHIKTHDLGGVQQVTQQ